MINRQELQRLIICDHRSFINLGVTTNRKAHVADAVKEMPLAIGFLLLLRRSWETVAQLEQ